MGVFYNTKIVTDGLLVYVDAANSKSYRGSVGTWYDLSGNGNNGTATGTPVYNSGIMTFAGTTDYYTFPTYSAMSQNNNNQVTIEVLFRTVESPVQGAMGYVGFTSLSIHSTSNLFVDCYDTGVGRHLATVWSNFSTTGYGKWIHAFGIYDGIARGFCNGEPRQVTSSFTQKDLASENFTVAAGLGYYALEGDVALARLYDRPLSEQEIEQNFNATRGRVGI